MKKFNFLSLFFILFSFSFAQEINEKLTNSRMGLYISPTINFISTEAVPTGSKLGVVYGYAFEIPLSINHYLESGFAISYKGGRIEEEQVNDYRVQYFTLPMFIKMKSREVGYFHYFAKIGPSLNFKIKEKISSNDSAKGAVIDVSIFLGAEYSLGGETSIEGSIFYNNNLTNSIADENMHALFHQLGIRLGFLF